MTKQEFLAAAIPAAKSASKKSGLPAGITVAQAAIESGWGTSKLSTTGNNWFGITCSGDVPSVDKQTREQFTQAQIDAFKKNPKHQVLSVAPSAKPGYFDCQVIRQFGQWSSMQANFESRDKIITTSPYYADARSAWAKGDLLGFVNGLAAHWASDQTYGEKIMQVYRANGLDKI